jgi:tripartite-type tricarboxylate transporter receptor subunit TctC
MLLASGGHSSAAVGSPRLLLPFLPSGPTELVGTVPASRIQRAMQAASSSALSDVVARMLARIVEVHLGAAVPIERMAAGAGARAVERLLGEAAGTRALLLASEALCVHAAIERPELASHLDRLQPVATCISVPYLLVRADAAASAAGCSVGSAGHGGRSTALAEAVAARLPLQAGGIPCREVTFNGGAAALQALLGGHLEMAVLPRALAGPWIDDGTLQAGPVPPAALVVPAEGWFAVLAGPGWPTDKVMALGDALQAGVAEPAQQAWLERLGLRAQPEPGPRLARRIRDERARLMAEKKRARREARP